MKAGDVIKRKDGEPFDGKYETARIGSVVDDMVWVEDAQGWFSRDMVVTDCHVVDHEGKPRNVPGRWHNIKPEEFEKMAAAALAASRTGASEEEKIKGMAVAIQKALEKC